jgi:hypothetical protein
VHHHKRLDLGGIRDIFGSLASRGSMRVACSLSLEIWVRDKLAGFVIQYSETPMLLTRSLEDIVSSWS